jgi:acylphosphatase
MRVARRYSISGLVQGVGFRYFTQAAAVREHVDGWVRNTAEGGVEIEAEGEQDALDRFERQIQRGPMSARVTRVSTVEIAATNRTGFRIR